MNFKIILNNNKNNEEVKINRARIAKDYKRDNKFKGFFLSRDPFLQCAHFFSEEKRLGAR